MKYRYYNYINKYIGNISLYIDGFAPDTLLLQLRIKVCCVEVCMESPQSFFELMMRQLRTQREGAKKYSQKDLAKVLGFTAGHLNAIENARECPSFLKLIEYLQVNNFDLEPLLKLKIKDDKTESDLRRKRLNELMDKIFELNEDQLGFLLDQIKVAEVYKIKSQN